MDPCSRRDLLKAAAGTTVLGVVLDEEALAAPPIPQRVLGKTGVRVPILGFGTAPAGIRRDVKNALELYNAALDAGIHYFDTAPTHTGYGRAQEQLGCLFKTRRQDVFLATKTHESRGDEALRLLEKNLKEMRTDHADLVHAHSLGDLDLDTALGKNGVFAALAKAKKEGLTRFIGVSGHHRPARFLRVLREFDLDVIMCAVNFADRYTYGFEGQVFPAAAQQNVGLVAMKVFAGMNYSDPGMSNSKMPPAHHDQALRYALSLPDVATAVVGMSTLTELRQNIARAQAFTPLTAQERQALIPIGKKLAARWGAHFGPVG